MFFFSDLQKISVFPYIFQFVNARSNTEDNDSVFIFMLHSLTELEILYTLRNFF